MATLQNGLDRIQQIRHTKETLAAYIKQRIATAAQELSRAGDTAVHCEIANEALHKLTVLLYAADSDGWRANVDSVTGRILVVVPWGSRGFASWALRKWEADVLRSILIARSGQREPRPALFDYSPELRTWFLNTGAYGSLAHAQHYLQREPISLALWRAHYAKWKQGQRDEYARHLRQP